MLANLRKLRRKAVGSTSTKRRLFESLEDRHLLASDLGVDLGPWVSTDVIDKLPYAETSLVHEYDLTTGEEWYSGYSEKSLEDELGAAEMVAHEMGFRGLPEMLDAFNETSGGGGPGPGEIVFGGDGRQLVANTLEWPYRAIGRLWMLTGASETSCTGVMISPYHVLTAGHCVNGVNGGGWANQVVFSAAQDGTRFFDASINTNFRRSDDQFYGEANGVWLRSYDLWTNNDNWDWDLAVVTLDRNLGNYTGWFGYGWNSNDSFYSSNTGSTAGYPGDLTPNEFDMWWDDGNAGNNAVTTHQLRTTDIDIWPGQSGSPIWYSGPSAHAVVSHHTYTDTNGNGSYDPGEPAFYNAFTRMTSGKFNDVSSWITADAGIRPATDRADLVDYDTWFNGTFASMNSSFVTAGSNFSVTSFPRNNGTAATGNYTVSFYASTNTTISGSDYFLGSVNLSSLAPFSWQTATLNVAFPASVPTGNYYVGWIMDSTGVVNEYLEGNNTGYVRSGQVTVGADDHGNSAATATRILADSATFGNLEAPGDKDWFYFEAAAGAQVTLATTLGTLGDSVLRLYGTDGVTQVAFDDDGGPGFASLLQYTVPAAGFYYASVEEYGNDASGTYSLALSHADDHGNSAGSATLIGAHSVTAGSLELAGDYDWFVFRAMAGAQVTLETQLGTLPDSILRLYDVDGVTEIAFDDDGGPGLASRIDYTIAATGNYYVRVEDFGNPNPGSYTIQLTHLDDYGEDAAAATPIGVNSTIVVNTEVGYDSDYLSFVAEAGMAYSISTNLITHPDTTLTLYDVDGVTALAYNDDTGATLASRIDWVAPVSGQYFVGARGFSWNVGAYELTLDGPGGPTGDFNADGIYDHLDIDALVSVISAGSHDSAYDLTGDGLVDLADRDAWLAEAGAVNLGPGIAYLLGDANLDRFVDGQDFINWNQNNFTNTPLWSAGDFNADGVVDGQDFIIWNQNKFTSADNGQLVNVKSSVLDKSIDFDTHDRLFAALAVDNEQQRVSSSAAGAAGASRFAQRSAATALGSDHRSSRTGKSSGSEYDRRSRWISHNKVDLGLQGLDGPEV